MEWMAGLIKGKVVVPGAAGLTDDDLDAAWTNQKIALAGGGIYYVNLSKQLVAKGQVKALDTFMVNYPHEPNRATTPLIPNAGWSNTLFKQKDAGQKAAGISFLKYISDEAFSGDFAKGEGGVSSYTALAKDWAGDDPDRKFIIDQVAK